MASSNAPLRERHWLFDDAEVLLLSANLDGIFSDTCNHRSFGWTRAINTCVISLLLHDLDYRLQLASSKTVTIRRQRAFQ
jgi:hypothetical protein